MEVMAAQVHLIKYYVDLARRRGVQAKRNSGKVGAKEEVFAEAYQRIYPQVVTELT
jgi:4-oxalomesaconate hydratase